MRLIKDPNSRTFEFLQQRLLKVVTNLQDWLVDNPAALMWLMCHWENIFYAGRIGYGYEGIVKRGRSCEDNPKYQIQDKIDYKNSDNEEFIYDAFANANEAMARVSEEKDEVSFGIYNKAHFDKIREVYQNRANDRYVSLLNKTNKTLDEWVEVLTNKRYRYSSIYGDRDRVMKSLLSTTSDYEWNMDGFITANNADTYVGWQETDITSFPVEYQDVIEQIIYCDLVQQTTEVVRVYIEDYKAERKRTENAPLKGLIDMLEEDEANGDDDLDYGAILAKLKSRLHIDSEPEPRSFKNMLFGARMMKFPDNVDDSYIQGGYEVVKCILDNPTLHSKEDLIHAHEWFNQKPVRKLKIDNLFNE